MKPILLITFVLYCTLGFGQTRTQDNSDFEIYFTSNSPPHIGELIFINVINNANGDIPNAIIIIGDYVIIEKSMRSCESWTSHPNRTYVLDKYGYDKGVFMESLMKIIKDEKLDPSNIFFIHFKNEFEGEIDVNQKKIKHTDFILDIRLKSI